MSRGSPAYAYKASTDKTVENCEKREVTRLNGIKLMPRSRQFVPVEKCFDLVSPDKLYFAFAKSIFESSDCTRYQVLYKPITYFIATSESTTKCYVQMT